MYTALAVILDKDRVLVGRLKTEKVHEYGGISYVFPSAQSDRKEDIKKNLIQEVKIQSHLEVNIVEKIGERIHPITHNFTEYYLCKETSKQEVKAGENADIEEFMWVQLEELSNYMPSLFEQVQKYLQTIDK